MANYNKTDWLSDGNRQPEASVASRNGPCNLSITASTIPHDDPEYVLATPEDIRKVINFISENVTSPSPPVHTGELFDGHLLIHCQAGISRSSAVALIVCAQLLGFGKEEAMDMVLAARPQARPNLWVVELADEALGGGGKLLEVAEINYNSPFRA